MIVYYKKAHGTIILGLLTRTHISVLLHLKVSKYHQRYSSKDAAHKPRVNKQNKRVMQGTVASNSKVMQWLIVNKRLNRQSTSIKGINGAMSGFKNIMFFTVFKIVLRNANIFSYEGGNTVILHFVFGFTTSFNLYLFWSIS